MARSVFFIKCKGGIRELSKVKAHVRYVGFRSKEIGDTKGYFGRDSDSADYKGFIERIENNKALKHSNTVKAQKLIFALKEEDYTAYKRSGKDYKDLVRATLKNYEEKHNVKLDWIANIHNQESRNPHCHVIIKGVSDIKGERGYKRITFKRDDLRDMRTSFQQAFDKDVKYKFHEREEVKEVLKETTRGFEAVLRALKREFKKEQARNEFEKKLEDERLKRERRDRER